MIKLAGKKVCVIGEFEKYTKIEVGAVVLAMGGKLVTESRTDIDCYIAGYLEEFTLGANGNGKVPDVYNEETIDTLKKVFKV